MARKSSVTAKATKARKVARKAVAIKKRDKSTTVGEDIVSGMESLLAHFRGEINLDTYEVTPEEIDVKALVDNLGMSRPEFAAMFGFSRRTLQEWEQKRRKPSGAARVLLKVIQKNPQAVFEALRAA